MFIFESLKENRKRNLAKLKRLLKKGVVEFEYKKIDSYLTKKFDSFLTKFYTLSI